MCGGVKAQAVPLVLALYGHPDAGSCWETWNYESMIMIGFLTIDGWPGCCMHPRERLFILVYVDEIKPPGPRGAVKRTQDRIAEVVAFEPPMPVEVDLGRSQRNSMPTIDFKAVVGNDLPGLAKTTGGEGPRVRHAVVQGPVPRSLRVACKGRLLAAQARAHQCFCGAGRRIKKDVDPSIDMQARHTTAENNETRYNSTSSNMFATGGEVGADLEESIEAARASAPSSSSLSSVHAGAT